MASSAPLAIALQELITILSAYPQASKVIFNDDDKIRLLKIAEIDYFSWEIRIRKPKSDIAITPM